MKILHVNHLLDPVTGGGTAERTFQLSRELSLAGDDVTILTLDIGQSRERGTGLSRLRIVSLPCINERFFLPRAASSQISSLVRGSDVVQMFGNWTILNAMVWIACRRFKKPFVFCPAGALPIFGRSRLVKRIYTRFVSSKMVKDAARCICITEDEKAHFSALGADPAALTVIANGIDPDQYVVSETKERVTRTRFGLDDPGRPFIFFLGRLNPIKGPDLLLDAFAKIAAKWPDHQLVFGGPDGGLLTALQERVAALGLGDRIRFLGFLDGQTKAALLRAAKILVIPSRSEAMSIVVLEAGACKCPVLFTDACGLESFASEDAGTMVTVDAQAISMALDGLLGRQTTLNKQAARLERLVLSEYRWETQAKKYQALFGEIVNAGLQPIQDAEAELS